ncbi:WYL domain-containing protein [Rhizobium leguminosarum]|nr:WYL domain-containing protein [Rhizobium leguminosarum]
MEFIDFRLFWNRRVNRGDIRDTFDISVQQASSDLAQYERLAPHNMAYDRALKTYVRTPAYKPALIEHSSERFLLQLVAIDNGWMQRDETWFDFDEVPPLDVATLKRTPTSSHVLLGVLDAIRDQTEITIEYRSLTENADAPRTIAPHALFYNSSRWYARAYSADHEDFRDYNLNRIGNFQITGARSGRRCLGLWLVAYIGSRDRAQSRLAADSTGRRCPRVWDDRQQAGLPGSP